MRILLIPYSFPPFNTIGAVRVGKIAKYLTKFGHEVRVVTAKTQQYQPTLPLEILPENVIYTDWTQGKFLVPKPHQAVDNSHISQGHFGRVLQGLKLMYKTLEAFPVEQLGWIILAAEAASRLVQKWQPDVIYASAPPPACLIVASWLSRKYGIPWVGEFRDLWVDDPYRNYQGWRKLIEERLERWILPSATHFVTVSEPLAKTLREKYGKPTAVILNGFEPSDYPLSTKVPFRDGSIRIVYTGTIFPGKRDPSPLFQALRQLGDLSEKVQVALYLQPYYGGCLEEIHELARQHGVEHLVEVNDMVPYKDSLRLQSEADILLLLLWNDPKERGVYTGKLFEYIGARRPILAIGYHDSVAAELIRDRDAGVVLDNPLQIAEQLQQWIGQKQQNRLIPYLSEKVGVGLSREEQTKCLERLLDEILF
ncbi:MAG: glycosyltransferase family 4 protein [Chamaesiphon sp.]